MNNNSLNVKFEIGRDAKDERSFKFDSKLPSFYAKILDKDEVGFYYLLKDAALEIEEVLFPKLHKNEITEINGNLIPVFRVTVNDKELVHYHLSDSKITELDFKGNEVDVFYFLKNIADKFEAKVSKEHKRILLGKKSE